MPKLLLLLLLFSPATLALTPAEEDRIAQCTMKGVAFGMIWSSAHNGDTKSERDANLDNALIGLVEKLKQDHAPPRIIDMWVTQASFSAAQPDFYQMLNDVVFDCLEVGY